MELKTLEILPFIADIKIEDIATFNSERDVTIFGFHWQVLRRIMAHSVKNTTASNLVKNVLFLDRSSCIQNPEKGTL